MPESVLPAAYALFLWWFSTGVVFYLDGLPRHTFVWSLTAASLLLAAALYGAHDATTGSGLGSVYLSFTCGLMAWVWIEATYYLGFLTGPRRRHCEEGCSGWRHFGHALQTSLYHEAAIVVMAMALLLVTAGGPNRLALWTFLLLMMLHQSARVNVFLGVRNVNEDLLPEHLAYLRSFLRRRPMNFLFPVSVTAFTIGAIWLCAQAMAASGAEAVGYTFLAALMIVGVLEHWFLVLPLDVSALWRWSLGSRGRASSPAPTADETRRGDGPASVCAGQL